MERRADWGLPGDWIFYLVRPDHITSHRILSLQNSSATSGLGVWSLYLSVGHLAENIRLVIRSDPAGKHKQNNNKSTASLVMKEDGAVFSLVLSAWCYANYSLTFCSLMTFYSIASPGYQAKTKQRARKTENWKTTSGVVGKRCLVTTMDFGWIHMTSLK